MLSSFFARFFSLERLSVRFATQRDVICRARSVQAKDVSAGGMKLLAPFALDQGESVTVSSEDGLHVNCRVVWTRAVQKGHEIGLLFEDNFENRGRWVHHLLPFN